MNSISSGAAADSLAPDSVSLATMELPIQAEQDKQLPEPLGNLSGLQSKADMAGDRAGKRPSGSRGFGERLAACFLCGNSQADTLAFAQPQRIVSASAQFPAAHALHLQQQEDILAASDDELRALCALSECRYPYEYDLGGEEVYRGLFESLKERIESAVSDLAKPDIVIDAARLSIKLGYVG